MAMVTAGPPDSCRLGVGEPRLNVGAGSDHDNDVTRWRPSAPAQCRLLMLIMTIGPLPGALEPGFHCVRTHWIRGFMGFRLVRRGAPPDQLAKRYANSDSMNAAFTPYGLVRVVPE